jgi:hypothetical protein
MIQRRIRHAREQVLGGRGPGASPMETARWMRERPSLGGQPPAVSREQAAEQARLARGDPEDLVRLAVRRDARLAATLGTARTRLGGRLTSARRHARIVIPAVLAGFGIVLSWQAWARADGQQGRARRASSAAIRERGGGRAGRIVRCSLSGGTAGRADHGGNLVACAHW